MKTLLKLLLILTLLISSASCQTQKTSVGVATAGNSEILYQQALQALGNHKFVIEAAEIYLPSSKSPIKTTSGSYLSMDNNQGIINFTPDVFPRDPWSYLVITDNTAKITKVKEKKNGDLIYKMKIDGEEQWLRRSVIITLYKNTNQCFVQINDRAGSKVADFKGNINPKK